MIGVSGIQCVSKRAMTNAFFSFSKDIQWSLEKSHGMSFWVSRMSGTSDAAVRVGSVQRPFLLNRDPHRSSGQLGS